MTKEEHLAAATEAWESAERLGILVGTDLTPLVELIAERNRLRLERRQT